MALWLCGGECIDYNKVAIFFGILYDTYKNKLRDA